MNNAIGYLTFAAGICGLTVCAYQAGKYHVNKGIVSEEVSKVAERYVTERMRDMDISAIVRDKTQALVNRSFSSEIDNAISESTRKIKQNMQSEITFGVNRALPDVQKEVADAMLRRARTYSTSEIDKKIVDEARKMAAEKFQEDVKSVRQELKDEYKRQLDTLVDDMKDRYSDKLDDALDSIKDKYADKLDKLKDDLEEEYTDKLDELVDDLEEEFDDKREELESQMARVITVGLVS